MAGGQTWRVRVGSSAPLPTARSLQTDSSTPHRARTPPGSAALELPSLLPSFQVREASECQQLLLLNSPGKMDSRVLGRTPERAVPDRVIRWRGRYPLGQRPPTRSL